MEFIKELWNFLIERKKLWLAPIILIMLLLGALLIIAQSRFLIDKPLLQAAKKLKIIARVGAGLENIDDGGLESRMRQQTEAAVFESDVVLILIDARAGITPLDSYFCQWLRTVKRQIILVANKCEGRKSYPGLLEAYRLGLGEPVAVSAEHGEGMADLYSALLVFDKIQVQDKEETISDLIDRQQIHLLDENVEKKIEETCNSMEKNNIGRCSNLYNNEDKDYMKRLYSESELIIINNS